jgi:hypothetical protein
MRFFTNIFSKSTAPKLVSSFAWANDLKGMDDISAIEYVTQQLNASLKCNLFEDEQHLQALFSADEKTHIIVERITAHYINIDNIGGELEERFTNSVFLYHRQIFLIYLKLIDNLAAANHPCLLTMLARAMNCATEMIKWRYYNYHGAPANVWLQLSQLYKIGKQQSLLNQEVQLYDDKTQTTLSILYIQACMLGSLESLSFKRQQIDLVSKILTKWAAKTVISDVYDEKKHLFYVDTAKNVPAKRIRNFEPADSYLYWCFASLNSKVELSLSALELNIAPKQLTLEEFVHNKHFLPTLEILHTEWSRSEYKRQRRAEERVKAVQSATTAYGFKDTCYQIKQYENLRIKRGETAYQGDKSFDERLAAHYVVKSRSEPNVVYVDMGAGYSNIVDECTKGLGLQISKQANEVSLGMMVGVSVREKKYGTRVGIIRSIKPIAGNELQIGVEVLSRSAFYTEAKNMSLNTVKVRSGSNSFNDTNAQLSGTTTNFSCLFLPEEPGISAQETLIIPRIEYNKNDVYKVNVLGTSIVIKLTEALERHEDWIRVAYTQDFSQ